jgi:hypothetical protein
VRPPLPPHLATARHEEREALTSHLAPPVRQSPAARRNPLSPPSPTPSTPSHYGRLRCGHRETRLAGKDKSPGRIRAESQKIAVYCVLLYRVQHPGRHPSRLQMIWRRTSGKRDAPRGAPLTLVGLRGAERGPLVNRVTPHADASPTVAREVVAPTRRSPHRRKVGTTRREASFTL